MSTSQNGAFIVIEGGDGAGKSLQIKKLEKVYEGKIIFTREPGGTEYAESIRGLALDHPLAGEADGKTQFMLMWASRAEHMNHLIIPSLKEGKVIISDRFDSSTFAYNIFAQEENGLVEYFEHTRNTILGTHTPDLYIYLDVTPEIGEARMAGREEEQNHFDKRPKDFKQKVRDGYFEFFKKVPHVIIDASRTPDEIFEDIQVEIKKFYKD